MTQHFHALNAYFDKIYVLTLDRAADRQENIKKVLDGLNWSFFRATDKNNFSADVLTDPSIYDDAVHKQTKRTHRSMNLGEVACAMSHVRMYQDMLDNGYERVLILEDDVLPEPQKLKQFEQLVSQLPSDWELLMLGYYGHKEPVFKYKLQQQVYYLFHKLRWFNWGKVEKNWIDNIIMRPYSEGLYEIGKVLGTHAYAVTPSAARKFIEFQSPVILQADRIFNYYQALHGLKAYAPRETLFTLSELSKVSSIQ